ncbi:hypothetical protein K504DRAFT_512758 [Pleomassaria siparia CBS 279.74]|uniref:BZIP domain-containing protein n=1 Tax=Pleomassaria siparia CBS 279.74 TaxID=1314801 RepID=A0A6G1K1B5_9PLEO|nr:hypothetical protein K504DRAFT_512758 [Pleomassaria siparia CBS 279.74]
MYCNVRANLYQNGQNCAKKTAPLEEGAERDFVGRVARELKRLGYRQDSPNSSSLPTTTTTFDFTSLTTASPQSSWLPSPAPHASRQLLLNQPSTDYAPLQTDFVLYDQPAQVIQRPRRAPSAPQLQPSFNLGQHLYANSAPSSTTGFQQPQLQHKQHQQRPPVPLFSSSSSNPSHQLHVPGMADLNSNNSFDSNMGSGINQHIHSCSSDMSPWQVSVSPFTSINDSWASGSTQTVSPKDIFNNAFGSAPPSTSFTNLTSPDMGESPCLDGYEQSPGLFAHDVAMGFDDWYSLFPSDESKKRSLTEVDVEAAPVAPALERTVSSTSMARSSSSSTNSPLVLDSSHLHKSFVSGSPALNACITKPRRRKGPLPPITIDEKDKSAAKRARNTLAARDSRARKAELIRKLELHTKELEAEVEKWKSIAIAQGYNG